MNTNNAYKLIFVAILGIVSVISGIICAFQGAVTGDFGYFAMAIIFLILGMICRDLIADK